MANYTTLALLRQRLDAGVLAGLADDMNTPPDLAAEQTQAVISRAIGDGGALIDSILGGQLDLAAAAADPSAAAALERLNATLALHCLFARRCIDESMNPLAASRELAEAQLRAVARGAATLGGSLGSPPDKTAWSTTEQQAPVISRSALVRF